MDTRRFFSKTSPLGITATGLILVILVGLLDYETGSQISLSILYLLPIALVTWFSTARIGILIAVISACTWLIADLTTGTVYISPFIPYWNAILRFFVFLTVVFLESALKNVNQDLERRVLERTELLANEIEERKKVESQLEQYAKRLTILHEIDQAILAAESLESIGRAIITHIRNLPGCDSVSFILIDFENHQATVFDFHDNDTHSFETEIQIDDLPTLKAHLELLRQQGVVSRDDLRHSPLEPSLAQLFQLQNYGSLLTVPIFVQEELIGCLNFMSENNNGFSSDYIDIGREIANQLGIAIKQARMISQLRKSQEDLQLLSQRLLDVQEVERRTIARELHDEVGQALTGIWLTLELAAQSQSDVVFSKIDQAYKLVSNLMEVISQMSLELRPALLDDLGLLPALLWYLGRYASQTQVKPIFRHSGLEKQRFASQVETAAFRILQEALTNVARHACVDDVNVTLWLDGEMLGLQVEDEGIGFDVETALSSGNSSGLLGMRERATLLDGKLTIESSLGNGTRVLAELPIHSNGFDKGSVA